LTKMINKVRLTIYWRSRWAGQKILRHSKRIFQIVRLTIYWRSRWAGQKILWHSKRIFQIVRLDFLLPQNNRSRYLSLWSKYWSEKSPEHLTALISQFNFNRVEKLLEENKEWDIQYYVVVSKIGKQSEKRNALSVISPFELEQVRPAWSRSIVAQNAIRHLSIRRTNPYHFSGAARLVFHMLRQPSSIRYAFSATKIYRVRRSGNELEATDASQLGASEIFVKENADFWVRTFNSNMFISIDSEYQVESVAVNVVFKDNSFYRANHEIRREIELLTSDLRIWLNFLGATNSKRLAKLSANLLFEGPLKAAFELIAGTQILDLDLGPNCDAYQLVVPSKIQNVPAPLVSHSQFEFAEPCYLENVTISFERFITTKSMLFVLENAADLRSDMCAGLWPYVWSSSTTDGQILLADQIASDENLDEAIAGFGRYDCNWFHFVIETLPRIMTAVSAANSTMPILMQHDAAPAGIELVSLLFPNQIHVLNPARSLKVGRLHAAKTKSAALDSEFSSLLNGNFDTSTLKEIRDVLFSKRFDINQQTISNNVMILRKSSYRRITNLSSIEKIASKANYQKVDMSSLGFLDQFRVISQATNILMQGGAAMANLVFARPGTTCIFLVGPSHNQADFWLRLCESLDVNCKFVIGETNDKQNAGTLHENFSINEPEFRSLLK